MHRTLLGVCCRFAFFCWAVAVTLVWGQEQERHPNDGWYNNLLHPDWGAIDTHLLRRSLASYSDGVYEPSGPNRPNPFRISEIAFNGTNGLGSARGRNALLVFFGQQIVEEIMDAQRPGCPVEFLNIPVPKTHMYNPLGKDDLEMPFQRARFDQRTGHSPNNPRQQLNEITPYIDGTLIYGVGKSVQDALREFKDGRLLTTSDDIKKSWPVVNDIRLPFANPPAPRDNILLPVSRFRRYGNLRTHENPFLTAMAVVWFRYHNFVAQQIKNKSSSLDDEHIFNAARKRVIAQYQKTVMYEWLPVWLSVDDLGESFNMSTYPYKGGQNNIYVGYDPNVHPGISSEFQVAALRYGHTLVPSGVLTKKIASNVCTNSKRLVPAKFTTQKKDAPKNVEVEGIRLCNSFWVPEETLEGEPGLDAVIRGMIYTLAGREDNIIVNDIRELVFGSLDWSRRDIGALNIQRGRDLGLPGYNDVRAAYGLQRKKTWNDISPLYPTILSELKRLYGNAAAPDDLDIFPGGLLETTLDGPGELFKAITLDQFLRIRHGDRFWYENEDNGLFTKEEVQEIEKTSFVDILKAVTNVVVEPAMDDLPTTQAFLCVNGSDPTRCMCNNPEFDENPVREECVPLSKYDYFSGSEVSLLVTVIVVMLSLPATIGMMICLARLRHNSLTASAEGPRPKLEPGPNHVYATEWIGRSTHGLLNSREVKISLDDTRVKILVASIRGQVVRMIDLRRRVQTEEHKPRASVTRSNDKGSKLMILAVPGEIDLVMYFPSHNDRDSAFSQLQNFFTTHDWEFHEGPQMAESIIWREAVTMDQRKHVLAIFFKSVLAELASDEDTEVSSQDKRTEEVLATKLTRTEFADALGLQPQSLFVRNMFLLVDSSGDGFVSFDEFKAYFGILYSGKPEDKAEMFFKMFDTSRSGKLTRENYKKMILSLIELNEAGSAKAIKVDELVDAVLKQVGKEQEGYLTLDDFKTVIFSNADDIWRSAVLNLEVAGETQPISKKRKTVKDRTQNFVSGYKRVTSMVATKTQVVRLPSKLERAPKSKFDKFLQTWTRYINNRRRQIFWLALYTLVVLGIFIERAYYYSVEREHAGLRRMAGYGVSVTRGAASAQMFTYASLLVTMCRNTLTIFRETFLHRFIPFDNAHDMHIYVAAMAMFFTVIHVIGHLINFYHISTQASLDLNCYFTEFFRPYLIRMVQIGQVLAAVLVIRALPVMLIKKSHILTTFHYWTYQTITGITGVLLVVVLVVLYVFATPYARRNVFTYFKSTHNLYIVVYILMFLHGAARLVQPPLWSYFFLGPMVLFILDKLVSASRNKVLLPVHKATQLPSGVISLVFKRPLTFDYQSGQWVRIACPKLGKGEYHPFTLTSAPHEEHLSLHIRAVGPWTNNIQKLFDYTTGRSTYPKIYLDGPFGESHQDWYRYPVSVLVGGGIGVTPFASILKDIANRAKGISRLPCQKVYFVWVTRTQQSFEWMTDIIRQVETADSTDYVDVQICITQLKEQFDLRTTLLYICERHFQKIAGVSMFTGLRAKTHFGRPKFQGFFQSLKAVHRDVGQIGVFSCGPPAMTSNVQQACTDQNAFTGPSLIHHFENF